MSGPQTVKPAEQTLCGIDGCRLLVGHGGAHNCFPAKVWEFMLAKDQDKLEKAGYATPRGGAKGAYQNHVVRANRVIIPYEKLELAPLAEFENGYIIRLHPEQYFEAPSTPKPEFQLPETQVKIGENAFLLYRTAESLQTFPPLATWKVRELRKAGKKVKIRRGKGVSDKGHYVVRIAPLKNKGNSRGESQGVFAPEYANSETNFLCRCVLAWLSLHTVDSPYTTTQAPHLKAILKAENLLDDQRWEFRGVLRHGLTTCPLCTCFIRYAELHEMLNLDDEDALENASIQIEGATRSTIVNLFHLDPLRYDQLDHKPEAIAWGHATCNTRLGQRRCFSVAELQQEGVKVGLVKESGIETIGWLSHNWEMMRSPNGAVWIRICLDREEERLDPGAVDPPAEEGINTHSPLAESNSPSAPPQTP